MVIRLGESHISWSYRASTLIVLSSVILAYPALFLWAYGTSSPYVLPPDSRPYGFSLGEWAAKSWQWVLSLPPASAGQPGGDLENSCAINQNGSVWYLRGSGGEGGVTKFVCTIPAGTALLATLLTGMCSYADTPNAKSDSDLLSCAMSGDEGALIEMSIDGVKLNDINRYRVQSPPFDLTIAEGNPFGIPPGPTRAVADCWCIMIDPLPAGRHLIQYSVSIPGNPTIGMSSYASEVTYDLMVQGQ